MIQGRKASRRTDRGRALWNRMRKVDPSFTRELENRQIQLKFSFFAAATAAAAAAEATGPKRKRSLLQTDRPRQGKASSGITIHLRLLRRVVPERNHLNTNRTRSSYESNYGNGPNSGTLRQTDRQKTAERSVGRTDWRTASDGEQRGRQTDRQTDRLSCMV